MDKEFMYGLARSQKGKIKEIRDYLSWEGNKISPYRDRLLKKGVGVSSRYGHLDIALPYFKGYVLDHYSDRVTMNLPYDL